MATSDLSSVSLSYTEKPLSPEELKKQAEEKKAKVKAEAQQKLQETPIHDAGSSMDNKIQQRFINALKQREQTIANIEASLDKPIHPSFQPATTNATSSVSVPIGQPQAQPTDRFSLAKMFETIDGYEEVKEDKDVSGFISSLTKWFFGAKTNSVNSTELSQIPAQSAGIELGFTPEETEVLRSVGVTDMGEGLTQGQTADKSQANKSQAEQLQEKTAAFQRMQEIQTKLNDPNVSPEEKAKLMQEAKSLYSSTPEASQTLPAGVVNTSESIAANLKPEEIQQAIEFVSSHAATGLDDEDPAFKALPKNIQNYIRAVASDATQNSQNGVKPADYKLPELTP